jgi:hypothetical protein
MGYRTYIGEMPKKEYNKIKSMTEEELIDFYKIEKEEDGSWYKGVYDYGKELYEFGKYVDFHPPKKSVKNFFKNKELQEKYDEEDLHIVTKEFLAYIIETYRLRISTYYQDMLKPFFEKFSCKSEFLNSIKIDYDYPNEHHIFDFSKITQEEQDALFKMIEHIKTFNSEWNYLTPYNLDNGEDKITNSWKYEYAIFELVRIYKTFDWKKKVMIYYGY